MTPTTSRQPLNHLLLLLALLLSGQSWAGIGVANLRVENLKEPLGIDTSQPRFSWEITADDETGVEQTAYQIEVKTEKETLWDSGRMASAEQLWVDYGGQPLKSNQHLQWRVRVFTNKGHSPWSPWQRFSIGLLSESKWGGRWIGLESLQPGEQRGTHTRLAARYLRKVFRLDAKPVRRATAFIAGLGLYRLFVNGAEVGADDVLKPAPSDYRKTIYYNTYDVTPLLAEAAQHGGCLLPVGIVLGNGRYFAQRQDKPYKNVTFGLPKCRMNILVEYADGTTQRLATDDSWRVVASGPVRANNEYDGEEYDARMELGDWLSASFDDAAWLPAERTAIPEGTLRPQMMPAMRAVPHRAKPVVCHEEAGKRVVDFGQNMAGWVAFRPLGKPGDTIRVRYAERLNSDGTLYTENLRDARSEDVYVCGPASGLDVWHPSFVYHGFRYVEISGNATDLTACSVADDMEQTGHLACSDTLLNKVLQHAWWGIRSNYKGMPVDCPQRNERQPWLGDRTVGARGESFFFDNERLYAKWTRDICEAQRSDGVIPDVAPAFWNYYTDDVTWPAALPFACQMLMEQYGNSKPWLDARPFVEKWARHMLEEHLHGGLITKNKYGDWCMPPEKLTLIHSEDPARKTDGTLIATAYMIRCMQLLGGDFWTQQCRKMTDAFNRAFLTCKRGTSPVPGHALYPDSVFYGNNTATANLLPLAFGIVPDSLRAVVAQQVVRNVVVDNKGHVSSGVIGISWLLTTLSACGHGDVAYMLATQRTYPSWGYMAEQGATTIWELWNGDHADAKMNSANHVMLLGDLIAWCYQQLGGIRLDDVASGSDERALAYKHFLLKPDFSLQDCDSVNCSYRSPYGLIVSRWQKQHGLLTWQVGVPCNTTASVFLPDGSVRRVGSGHYEFKVALPQKHKEVLSEALVSPGAVSCHASTIVETREGSMVMAYFAGTYERNPDCNIYVNIKEKGAADWGKPILAADGGGLACWNPVLTEMPGGELWLFYKVGKTVKEWTGWLTRSVDGGHTWGPPEPLPKGFLGPVKNKPLLLGNRLVCGSSTEDSGWRFHVEIFDLADKTWTYVGPVESTVALKTDDNQLHPIDCIQPSLLQLSDGRLQALMRTHNAHLATSYSSDGGLTWTPVTLLQVENNQSGTDAVTLRDGRHVLIYNNFQTLPGEKKGPRTPLSLAVSSDGLAWSHWLTLEDSASGEFSYPAIIQGSDGTLHCTYTWRRQRVAYKQVALPE